jgi:hypothetical protein
MVSSGLLRRENLKSYICILFMFYLCYVLFVCRFVVQIHRVKTHSQFEVNNNNNNNNNNNPIRALDSSAEDVS